MPVAFADWLRLCKEAFAFHDRKERNRLERRYEQKALAGQQIFRGIHDCLKRLHPAFKQGPHIQLTMSDFLNG
ncbi:hypothetical protein D9M70_573340 [compost metagenome]